MNKFDYIITDELGIHARIAVSLVRETSKYNSDIIISCNGKEADGKDLLKIMSLGAEKDMVITISVIGEDQENAAINLEKYINENL